MVGRFAGFVGHSAICCKVMWNGIRISATNSECFIVVHATWSVVPGAAAIQRARLVSVPGTMYLLCFTTIQ